MSGLDVALVTPSTAPAWRAVVPGTLWPSGGGPPDDDPTGVSTHPVGAWREGRPVGRLRAHRAQADLVLVDEIVVAEGEDADRVAPAMLARLGAAFVEPRVRLYVEEVPEDAPLQAWVERAGFSLARRKVVVGRSLPFEGAVDDEGLTYVSLAAVGEAAFAEALAEASEGDPFLSEDVPDARRALGEHIRVAGPAFDPRGWWLARRGGRTVGAVLPQRYAEDPRLGTLFHVGVLPPYRHQGLGRILHAAGLRALGAAGATRYVGSTDERNAAMRAVFARNGCEERAWQRFYAPPRSGPARETAGRTPSNAPG